MLDSRATGMILLTSLFCFLKWQEFFFREFREKINIFFFSSCNFLNLSCLDSIKLKKPLLQPGICEWMFPKIGVPEMDGENNGKPH